MRLALALTLLFSCPLLAQQQHIAPTDPLSPAAEAKTFKVPDGFTVQLVAADPDIQKPIQMAFDAAGRLWVATSHHYPFAAEKGKSSDRIYVLSDFAADGKAGKVTRFADTLNIPIGILPLPDGKSCLASSVGEIVKLTDTDGDGKADTKETILSGFGTRDTHGMYNSFRLLPDGWIYACHGFANDSKVTAKDGSTIHMNSGNTFRFRPDGSRIEPWTFGQVNPFGMTLDPHGNLYTADCHSKPITQLIRGATYQSFSKPHDGLGFALHVTAHSHGSTALCGLAWYDATQYPREYKNCLFLGNVVTNRVNADRIRFRGSTPVAEELPDFLVSKDPWFRPTDIQLGPDGCLYVADFYNRIIGHYEVDLKHPGRDKDRGRIWRIVWTGEPGVSTPGFKDLTKLDEAGLTKALTDSNLTVRMLAAQQFRARFLEAAAKRFAPMTVEEARQMLKVQNPFVWRAAIEVLTGLPDPENIEPLLVLLSNRDVLHDSHLKHAGKVALRNALGVALTNPTERAKWVAEFTKKQPYREREPRPINLLAEAALGLPTWDAAYLIGVRLAFAEPREWHNSRDRKKVADYAQHIGRYGSQRYVYLWALRYGYHPELTEAFTALAAGLQASNRSFTPELYYYAEGLVVKHGDAKLANLLRSVRPNEADFKEYARLKPDQREQYYLLLGRANDSKRSPQQRVSDINTLVLLNKFQAYPILAEVLATPDTPTEVRSAALVGLANSSDSAHMELVFANLKAAPADLVARAASILTTHKAGAEGILTAVSLGKLSPRLLQDRAVVDRLKALKLPNLDARIAELTRGLPPAEKRIADLIRTRSAAFAKATSNPKLGLELFQKNCAACHQVGDVGKKIGPQLDGIGNRGLDRVLEDVLDPSRNVDAEFRTRVLNLVDGRTVSGAFVRIDGAIWVLADQKGEEVRVPLTDIESWKHSPVSPMPANFGEAIPEADFHHLIGYLLEQKAKEIPPPKK